LVITRLSSFKEQQNQPERVNLLRPFVKQINPKSGIFGGVVILFVYLMRSSDLKRKINDVLRRQ